jgi:hypothetical protein
MEGRPVEPHFRSADFRVFPDDLIQAGHCNFFMQVCCGSCLRIRLASPIVFSKESPIIVFENVSLTYGRSVNTMEREFIETLLIISGIPLEIFITWIRWMEMMIPCYLPGFLQLPRPVRSLFRGVRMILAWAPAMERPSIYRL